MAPENKQAKGYMRSTGVSTGVAFHSWLHTWAKFMVYANSTLESVQWHFSCYICVYIRQQIMCLRVCVTPYHNSKAYLNSTWDPPKNCFNSRNGIYSFRSHFRAHSPNTDTHRHALRRQSQFEVNAIRRGLCRRSWIYKQYSHVENAKRRDYIIRIFHFEVIGFRIYSIWHNTHTNIRRHIERFTSEIRWILYNAKAINTIGRMLKMLERWLTGRIRENKYQRLYYN